ncbi:hypothetical protein CVT24_002709 [Panaeolus cyanescens]|uniref:Ketoreductase (KR) domain-containing protein n=1 Tax=Panaeolus cyanescens TaxID=181874 RepID=A0A409YY73_9AGAR|nr:hypothetical protein CVT24_002709 [Panaeolus cyanescens]
MQLTIRKFLKEQCQKVPLAPQEDLAGKTVIVVGANTGIGYEAAKHFASMNPGKLILACRDQRRGDEALQRIQQETGCNNIEVSVLDLKSFDSVNAFADRFEKSGQRLDIIIANAAVLATNLEVTDGGWESGFQVNNLSTNLLCLLLIPALSRTATQYNTNPRIVVVTRELHYWAQLAPKVLSAPNPIEFDTKLLNVLFIRALSSKLSTSNPNIIATSVNPGFCASSLRREFTGLQRFVVDWLSVKLLARTSEKGSRQLVWAALAGSGKGGSKAGVDIDALRGAYVSSMTVCEPSDFVISDEGKRMQDLFWDGMMTVFKGVNPKVEGIVAAHF